MPPRKNKREKEDEKIQKEEEERKKKEKEERISNFAKILEDQLIIAESQGTDCIRISHHTIVIIDDVCVDIWVGKDKDENKMYSYYITNGKLKSSDENDEDEIMFLEKEDFATLVELLTNLEEVEKTYRFVEHKLVSPSEYEFAQNQRIFFPIPSDKDCSICYDSTIEYTVCNHPICFKCRIKCIMSGNTPCPICRENNICIFPHTLIYKLCE